MLARVAPRRTTRRSFLMSGQSAAFACSALPVASCLCVCDGDDCVVWCAVCVLQQSSAHSRHDCLPGRGCDGRSARLVGSCRRLLLPPAGGDDADADWSIVDVVRVVVLLTLFAELSARLLRVGGRLVYLLPTSDE